MGRKCDVFYTIRKKKKWTENKFFFSVVVIFAQSVEEPRAGYWEREGNNDKYIFQIFLFLDLEGKACSFKLAC